MCHLRQSLCSFGLWGVFTLITGLSSAYAAPEDPTGETVSGATFFLPTTNKNGYGSAAIRLDLVTGPTDGVQNSSSLPTSVLRERTGRDVLMVFVPGDLSDEEIRRFVTLNLATVQNLPPFSRISVVRITAKNLKDIAATKNAELRQAAAAHPEVPGLLEATASGEAGNNAIVAAFENWKQSARSSVAGKGPSPKSQSMVGLARTLLTKGAPGGLFWVIMDGPGVGSFLNMAFFINFELIWTWRYDEWARFRENVTLPAEWLIGRWFNRLDTVFKVMAVNLSVSAPYTMMTRSFHDFAIGATPSIYTLPFLKEFGGILAVSIPLNSFSDTGITAAGDRGYLSPIMKNIVNNILGVIGMSGAFAFGVGMDRLAFTIFAVEWGARGLVGTVGHFLPDLTGRNAYLISNNLDPDDKAATAAIQNIGTAVAASNLSIEEINRQLAAIPRKATLGDYLSKLTRKIGRRMRELFPADSCEITRRLGPTSWNPPDPDDHKTYFRVAP